MKTLTLLRLMADGKPWTSAQLKEATGMTTMEVENTVNVLRRGKYLRAQPVLFIATERGLKRSHTKTIREKTKEEIRKERNLRLAVKRAERAERLLEAEPVKPKADVGAIVAKAIQTRHPLHACWGAA